MGTQSAVIVWGLNIFDLEHILYQCTQLTLSFGWALTKDSQLKDASAACNVYINVDI